MELNLEELRAMLALCQQYGVQRLRMAGVEIVMGWTGGTVDAATASAGSTPSEEKEEDLRFAASGVEPANLRELMHELGVRRD